MRLLHYNHSKQAGFTLLEICLALFIIALFIGAAVPVMNNMGIEKKLRTPAKQLELYAKTARNLAVANRRPYEIVFDKKEFLLQPVPGTSHRNTDLDKEEVTPDEPVFQCKLATETEINIQRWDEKKMRKIRSESWVFQPTGICEPIRIEFRQGEAWLQLAFHPLTARVQEEAFYFP